ncbi:MAG: transposase [Gemmatimonadota bacterium]|nr:transposase [Gemmatimonadota bacterium]
MPYSHELKDKIVKLASDGQSVASLAREHEPSESTIRKWVKQAQESEAGPKEQTETEGVATDPAQQSGDGPLFSQPQPVRETPETPVASRSTALSAPETGVLATNDRNLMYMLAVGLLMPPSGFGGKHYRDTLSAFPGWLPLFVDPEGSAPRPPYEAVEESTREARHLRPALVEVDLRDLGGMVQAHGPDGWAKRRLEDGVATEESLLLFPAPLPVSRIRSVVLRSIEEQRAIEGDASDFANVSFDGLDLKADQACFDSLSDHPWPPPDGPAERPASLAAAQAAGGAMAILHRLANMGDLSLQAAQCALDWSGDPPDDSILRPLPKWIAGCVTNTRTTPQTGQNLFWGAVDRVVQCRDQGGQNDATDALVTFYREAAQGMEGELRTRATAVVSTLESLGGGLGGDTVSSMLDKHPTPTGRAAILFLLRRKSRELFDLMGDYPQLDERDRLAAGILFGARDGWLKLPLALRGSPELANAVTHRMAVLAHRLDGSGCELGTAPPRVRPLREIFSDPGGWGSAEEEAALRLASELEWKDCYRTTVTLEPGAYEVRIESGSVYIDCADRPRVDTHLLGDRFVAHLARSKVDANLEADIRARLGTAKS